MKWLQIVFLVIFGLAALATGTENRLGHRARRQVPTDGASVTMSSDPPAENQNSENQPSFSGAQAPGGGWGGGGNGGGGGWGWGK